MITVFLVEDEPSVREGLRMWLGLAPDIRIVGEAATGEQAVKAILTTKPDVVVMDLLLPGMDGVATIAQLHEGGHAVHAAVVALSLRDSDMLRAHALDAGARAFVAKHEPNEVLLDAIRRVTTS